MFFILDENKKIAFGWSAKSGCSHIKKLIHFLIYNDINYPIHSGTDFRQLPYNDMQNYTIIIFVRNPYKRLVSGFLNKYKLHGGFRDLWQDDKKITFRDFVDELIEDKWIKIDKHHFTQQTSEKFNEGLINKSKEVKLYDIEKIDYEHFENMYNVKIPEDVLNFRGTHIRGKYKKDFTKVVWDLNMPEYFNFNVETKYFYNEEIKNKVYNFYKNDFVFFKENGFDYENAL